MADRMAHQPGPPYSLDSEEIDGDDTLARSTATDADGRFWRRAKVPLAIFVLAAAIYAGFAGQRLLGPSPHTHFVYLANTFNSMLAAPFDEDAAQRREGRLPFELDREPPHRNDWASYWELRLRDDSTTYRGIWLDRGAKGRFQTLDGKVYQLPRSQIVDRTKRSFVSFPPAPAVLMMPMAAIWGYQVNDVLLTVLLAALNVMLVYVLLRRLSEGGRSGRSRRENIWLTVLFAFGTAHFWSSVLGEVWFTALIMGVTCTLLYILFAIDARRPLLAGLCLAIGFATRTPLLFSAIFFAGFVLFPGGTLRERRWGEAARKLAWFCLPTVTVGLLLLWMNYVRFGSITEFGHTYLATGQLQRIQTYGLFNYHFLSKNLSAMWTLLPRLQLEPPYILISKHGMSVLATTPALVYLFMPAERRGSADRLWWRLTWATVAACALPALFYQNTGYAQFGYRFILDYLPYLIVLLAVGRHPLTWTFKACIVFACLVNGFGAVTFKRMHQFYREGFFL
jgi:hypothetical protein